MSLYYILNTDDYTGDISQIGEIMNIFEKRLYKQTGLRLGTYVGPSSEELSKYFKLKGMEYVTEEVMWINMTDAEKITKILEYIQRISDYVYNELIIIDPYLFCKPQNGYEKMLTDILSRCGFEKIIVITQQKHMDIALYENIKNTLQKDIRVYYSDEFHDRYWIANQKDGFSVGTSLNGLGKKYCSIQIMDREDVGEIFTLVKEIISNILPSL